MRLRVGQGTIGQDRRPEAQRLQPYCSFGVGVRSPASHGRLPRQQGDALDGLVTGQRGVDRLDLLLEARPEEG